MMLKEDIKKMEKKYYSEESPFVSGELTKWDLLVNSLDTNETTIEVVEELLHNTDSEDRMKINELLNKPVHYFKSQQPIERSVSLSPFLTKNTYNSVCIKYKLTGEIIDELGSRVDPDVDIIHVDGVRIAQTSGHIVLALNKPRGVVTTMSDDQGRECVGDLVAEFEQRLFHVGRLDADTEGLLLLTNDGELSQRLGHPSHGIVKTYLARVSGRVSKEDIAKIIAGFPIEGTPVAVTDCKIYESGKNQTVVQISIHEGRNRILRKLFDELGYPVQDLVRTKIGPIALGSLRSGHLRVLENKELGKLYSSVGL